MKNQESGKFLFWQLWLFYTSLLFAAASLSITFLKPIHAKYEQLLERQMFNNEELHQDSERIISFMRGPYGSTIACTYILLAYIAAFPFRRRERWARNSIIIAFGVWVLIDTLFCVAYRMYFQAIVLNGLSLIQKALPIIFTWKHFKNAARDI